MPVHAHDGAERLKPERDGEPAQQFVAAVVMDDGLRHDGTEPVMRSANHGGTWPPCNGRSALPARCAIIQMRQLEFAGRQNRLFMLCTMAGESGRREMSGGDNL